MISISQRLKKLRKIKRLSQQKVADFLGISRSAYSNYEQGIREPDITTIRKLCTLYGISADCLIGIDKN